MFASVRSQCYALFLCQSACKSLKSQFSLVSKPCKHIISGVCAFSFSQGKSVWCLVLKPGFVLAPAYATVLCSQSSIEKLLTSLRSAEVDSPWKSHFIFITQVKLCKILYLIYSDMAFQIRPIMCSLCLFKVIYALGEGGRSLQTQGSGYTYMTSSQQAPQGARCGWDSSCDADDSGHCRVVWADRSLKCHVEFRDSACSIADWWWVPFSEGSLQLSG